MTVPNRVDLRTLLIVSLYILWAASGITQGLSAPPSWLLWCQALLVASVVTTWCAVDARSRGKPIVPVLQMLLLFTWPITAPIYLIRSRGWLGLAIAIAHSAGLMGTLLAAFYASVALASRLRP